MARRLWWVVLWVFGGTAASVSAQSPSTGVTTWAAFVDACNQSGAGLEHLCACAATTMLDRCAARGATSEAAIGACLDGNASAWSDEIAHTCAAYGPMRLGPAVVPPTLRRPRRVTGPTVTRVDFWNASYNDCIDGADGAERRYQCACTTTYIVAACMPDDSTPESHLGACADGLGEPLLEAARRCASYGSLESAERRAAPPAPPPTGARPAPAAAPAPAARDVCGSIASADAAAGQACTELVDGLYRNTPARIAALVPARGRVRVGRRSLTAPQVEELLATDGTYVFLGADPSNWVDEVNLEAAIVRGNLVVRQFPMDGATVIEFTLGRQGSAYGLRAIAMRPRTSDD